MSIRICTYNIEWFENQFEPDNSVKQLDPTIPKEQALIDQRNGLQTVLQAVQPDLLGIVEAPNTTTTTGVQSTVIKLQNYAQSIGLNNFKAITGYVSPGRQELAILYDESKLELSHTPGGSNTKSNPRFDGKFFFDTDDDRIEEVYEFYRPPLEVKVKIKATQQEFYLMLVHTKSKGIFSSMDMVHWQRENERNRRKLVAECTWIRNRVDEWLEDGKSVVVMGDMNDGPGMDFYEMQFGKSAVEIIMGDIFKPQGVLLNYAGRPKWGAHGWEPSTTRFYDRFTHDPVNAFIDHILVSQNLPIVEGSYKIWNPFINDEATPIKSELLNASDHFPISFDIF